jgi:hypothetical protein
MARGGAVAAWLRLDLDRRRATGTRRRRSAITAISIAARRGPRGGTMEELLRLPMSLSRLLLMAVGLVVALFVIGAFSWPVAVLVVCFAALALPFMVAVWRAEHG